MCIYIKLKGGKTKPKHSNNLLFYKGTCHQTCELQNQPNLISLFLIYYYSKQDAWVLGRLVTQNLNTLKQRMEGWLLKRGAQDHRRWCSLKGWSLTWSTNVGGEVLGVLDLRGSRFMTNPSIGLTFKIEGGVPLNSSKVV